MWYPLIAVRDPADCPEGVRDLIEQRIVRAYLRLVIDPDRVEGRSVPIAGARDLQVRLTETPFVADPACPPFCLEVHKLDTGETVDSLACYGFDEDELEAAVAFVCGVEEGLGALH